MSQGRISNYKIVKVIFIWARNKRTNQLHRKCLALQTNRTSNMFFEILQETPSRKQITKSERNETHCVLSVIPRNSQIKIYYDSSLCPPTKQIEPCDLLFLEPKLSHTTSRMLFNNRLVLHCFLLLRADENMFLQ